MAILTTDPGRQGFDNLLTIDFADNLLFTQRVVSPDGITLSWQTPDGSMVATLESPLQPPLFGTIVGFDGPGAVASGLAVPLNILWYDFLNADMDAANDLFWGGADQITGADGADTLRGFAGRDVLDGGAGEDQLFGGRGNDRLVGGRGADVLDGGVGDDRLLGGTGTDILYGGYGSDVLVGGAGSDRLLGGAGSDTFVFASTADSPGADAPDAVIAFAHNDLDRIDLQAIDANDLVAEDQAFTAIGSEAFTDNAPGTLRWHLGPSGILLVVELNTDNDAAAEMTFLVNAMGNQLVVDDFIL